MLSLNPSLLARFWVGLSLIVLLVLPLGAQVAVDDNDEFDNDGFIESFFIPITQSAPFTSGVYLGPANDKNGPGQLWEPLSFNGRAIQSFGPSPIPLAQTFTANPSRSHLQPRGQTFDIITPPPLAVPESSLPESSLYKSSFYESAELSSAPTDPNLLREEFSEAAKAPAAAKPRISPVPQPSPESQRISAPKRSEAASKPGQLTFSIYPADTRVLVNDDLFGTGESLSAGQSRSLKPGVYAIEAEHGQYATERLMFSLSSGESVHVVIDLSAEGEARGRVDKSRPRSR